LYFPVNNESDALGNKERVIGISIDNVHKAYSFKKLSQAESLPITDIVNGKEIQIHYDKESKSAKITDKEGNLLSWNNLVLVCMVCISSRYRSLLTKIFIFLMNQLYLKVISVY